LKDLLGNCVDDIPRDCLTTKVFRRYLKPKIRALKGAGDIDEIPIAVILADEPSL